MSASKTVFFILLAALRVPHAAAADIAAQGGALYAARCAACHDHPRDRIPPRVLISTIRAPEDVVATLTSGVMREQAAGLGADDIRALAVYLTGREPTAAATDPNANRCAQAPPPISLAEGDWNGWGRDPSNSRYQPAPGFGAQEVPRLKLKWAFAFPGNVAFAQPVLVGGRVFTGGTGGRLHALDARTGCTLWTYETAGVLRTSVVVGDVAIGAAARELAYVGDDRGVLHALDASSGQPVWEARPDAHPLARVIGTPKLYDGRLYVPVSSMEEVAAADPRYACCTFRGSIAVLDAASGRKLWQHYAIETAPQPIHPGPAGAQRFAPAGGAIFSSPTLDLKRGALYVGTGDAYTEGSLRGTDSVLALDLASGKRRWQRQALAADAWILGCKPTPHANCPQPLGPDFDFAASPVLATMSNGRDVLIAAAKSGRVYGLDPDDRGRILWSTELAPGSSHGGILWGPATEAQRTFVAVAGYDMATGTGPGALVALDNATGKVLWRTPAAALPCAWGAVNCSQAQIGAVSAIPGVVFAGAMDGRLRAYRSSDGAVIWEFDTGGEFAAVNGAKAHGGAIDYGAQTIAYGMLFVQSGSMRQPGNLLLAFSVDGR